MSHLDEGVLHSLLDGELDESARLAAEAHLASCPDCRRDLDEAKALLAGADELIAAVELPPSTGSGAKSAGRRVGRSGPSFPWISVAWAASLVLAVGAGWFARPYQSTPARSEGYTAARTDSPAMPAATPAPSAEKAVEGDKDELKEERGQVAGPGSGRLAQTARVRDGERAPGATSVPAGAPPAPTPAQKLVPPEEALRVLASRAADSVGPSLQAAPPEASAEDDRTATSSAPGVPRAAASSAFAGKMAVARELDRGALNITVRRDQAAGRFQPTAMEAAVRMLGGSIRLVDGLTPSLVMVGPGGLVPGADPGRVVIRVVYVDPPGRELWLDQQRPVERPSEPAAAGVTTTALLPGDTLIAPVASGARSLTWIHQSGFRLALTGFLPADSLRALARRVQ